MARKKIKREIQWQAIDERTNKIIDQDKDILILVNRLKRKGYDPEKLLIHQKLKEGTWIL